MKEIPVSEIKELDVLFVPELSGAQIVLKQHGQLKLVPSYFLAESDDDSFSETLSKASFRNLSFINSDKAVKCGELKKHWKIVKA
jgi:hypothetical protein